MSKFLGFILTDFGPLIVFYILKISFSLKVAILGCVLYSIGYLSFRIFKKLEISPFLIFSTTVSILFGILDLYSGSVFFFKFESALASMFFGLFFGLSLLKGRKPIVLDFAERQGRIKEEEMDDDLNFYFRFLTIVWVGYFILKAIIYTIVGYNYTLEQGIAFRVIFGNTTFYSLLLISILGGNQIFKALSFFRLLPSSNVKS